PAPQQGGQFGGQQSAPQQGNNFGGQQPAQQNNSQNNNFGAPPAGSFDDFDDEIPF
ncbi:MAG TPA: single-stranded DNA-binding protein, partial [Cobetia sp.]|nr:single-stranded DNA-binding protein [Cobetia sp.]